MEHLITFLTDIFRAVAVISYPAMDVCFYFMVLTSTVVVVVDLVVLTMRKHLGFAKDGFVTVANSSVRKRSETSSIYIDLVISV